MDRAARSYTPKLKLWSHQQRAVEMMRDREAFAVFFEMRVGKTATILAEFGEDEARGEVQQLLVIAPAGVYRTWEVDIDKHLGDTLAARVQVARWESGPGVIARRGYKEFMNSDGPKILLVNIEALSIVKLAQQLVGQYTVKARTTVVIDESTVVKSPTAIRTRFCLTLSKYAHKRRILSGLPTPQGPCDIYSQFAFLDPGILGCQTFNRHGQLTLDGFKARYAIMQQLPFGPGRRLINVVKGYRDLDELKAKLAPHSIRVKLADCYDVPDKIYARRDIALTREQLHHYQEMKKHCTTVLNATERVTATIVLTQLLRLHQILAGHTKSDDGVITTIPENKTDELMAVLAEHPKPRKAIVWVAYDQDVKKLTAVLTKTYGEGCVARFWGDNADTREAEEKLFLHDPNCRFMLATAASGGRSRTWGVANLMVFYQNTFSLEHRLQAEERAQLVGKKDNVCYIDLVARDTVEEKILTALRAKMQLSDAVTGDKWKKWVA